jgi:uncharacterized protein
VVDALAARTLLKGEALTPPPGRADDFAWPRREVGREEAKGGEAMASASRDGIAPVRKPAASLKPKKHRSQRWDWSRGMVREPAFAHGNVW